MFYLEIISHITVILLKYTRSIVKNNIEIVKKLWNIEMGGIESLLKKKL